MAGVRALVLLPALAAAASLPACEPSLRHIDSPIPDVPPWDDGRVRPEDAGEAAPDADGADGDADGPPLPREVEDNDPFHGGTAQAISPPATLAGTIDAPTAERPDVDAFAVTATAGLLLRATAYPSTDSDADLALRIVRLGEEGDVEWERGADDPAAISSYRDAFIPEAGEYLVVVTDRANLAASPSAWRGGPGYGYELTLTLSAPSAIDVAALPYEWNGTISPAGFVQAFRAVPAAGASIQAVLRSSDGEGFDPLLTVFDTVGGSVIAEDDDAAGGFDSLVRFVAPGSPLLLVVDHLRADGSRTADLTLSAGEIAPGEEAEPNGGADAANDLGALPATASGTIAAPVAAGERLAEDRDVFRFAGEIGVTYAVSVTRRDGPASAADPFLSVVRPASDVDARLVLENPLALADESPEDGDVDARAVVTLRSSGPVYVEVRDARNAAAEREGEPPSAGSEAHRYVLRVETASPPPFFSLGSLEPEVSRSDAARDGGVPDAYRFTASEAAPVLVTLADESGGAAGFAPLAFLTDETDTRILMVAACPADSSATGYAFLGGGRGYLRVGDALGSGGAAFRYRVDVRGFLAAGVAEDPGDNDTIATAQPLSWPAPDDGVVIRGGLDGAPGPGHDPADVYSVAVAAGQRLVAFTGPGGGDESDTVLALLREDGSVVARSDDVAGSETLYSAVEALAEADGALYVEVSLWSATARGGYSLLVARP